MLRDRLESQAEGRELQPHGHGRRQGLQREGVQQVSNGIIFVTHVAMAKVGEPIAKGFIADGTVRVIGRIDGGGPIRQDPERKLGYKA